MKRPSAFVAIFLIANRCRKKWHKLLGKPNIQVRDMWTAN